MHPADIIKRFMPIQLVRTECVQLITLKASEDRADGTCDVTVFVDGEEIDQFVSTQVEVKCLAVAFANVAVPTAWLRLAEKAKHMRERKATP